MTKAIILDANRIGENMREEVRKAIYNRDVKILFYKGGKFERELRGQRENGGRRYREYANNGFLHEVCQKSVDRKSAQLIQKGLILSDDQHIIAIALVTGANILHTEDNRLIEDFQRCNNNLFVIS